MHMTNAFLEMEDSERFFLALAAVLGGFGWWLLMDSA